MDCVFIVTYTHTLFVSQAVETVTEDTYDLYGRQRSTSFNPGTAEHEASNTALGSFVLGIFGGNGLPIV